jgi:glycosyltransferase involved in cell wall biosynthesis
MRIAYLSGSTIPSRTANSIHVMKMCHAMGEAGHEVMLVARPGGGELGNDYQFYGVNDTFMIVKCRPPGSGRLSEWRYGRQATAKICEWGVSNLIFARHLPSLAWASRLGVPFVFEAHQPPSKTARLFEKRLFRRQNFDRLVVISEALRSEYRRIHPWIPEDKVVVCADAAEQPPTVPPAIPPTSGKLRIGYTGHLYSGRGIEIILKLAGLMPDLEFHIIGGSNAAVDDLREDAKVPTNVFVHGYVCPKLVPAYQQSMDVLIAPYQQQVSTAGGDNTVRWMSPLKLFEYMACAKPIVASDLPVLREVLTHGQNALLVSPNQVDEWKLTLDRLRNPSLRESLGRSAFDSFQNRYTWSARTAQILDPSNRLD